MKAALALVAVIVAGCGSSRGTRSTRTYDDPLVKAVGDNPRGYAFVDLQRGDARVYLRDLASWRFPATGMALSDCGIQTHSLSRVRVAVGEPLRIKAEIDGVLSVDALACYLGENFMGALRAKGIVVRNRTEGISIERDLDDVPRATTPKAGLELLASCHVSTQWSGCAAVRLGPPGQEIVIGSTLQGLLMRLRITGPGLGNGASEFVTAVGLAAARFPTLGRFASKDAQGALELMISLEGAHDVLVTLFREVIKPERMATSSMLPTLQPGDLMFVAKPAFRMTPAPGDLIEYDTPSGPAVNRLLASAGQTVRETPEGIWIDDVLLPTELIETKYAFEEQAEPKGPMLRNTGVLFRERLGDRSYVTLRSKDAGPGTWTVPTGHVFVLGDNRSNANDSRTAGPVPVGTIHGRVLAVWLAMVPDGLDWNRSGIRPE